MPPEVDPLIRQLQNLVFTFAGVGVFGVALAVAFVMAFFDKPKYAALRAITGKLMLFLPFAIFVVAVCLVAIIGAFA